MNRIYDLGNKAKDGFWCAAPDEATAIRIALAKGHAKKAENLTVNDVTESFAGANGIEPILAGPRTGRIALRGTALRIQDVLNGVKPPPSVWMFMEDINKS